MLQHTSAVLRYQVIADAGKLDTNLRRLGTVAAMLRHCKLGALQVSALAIATRLLAAASYQALSAGFTETGANYGWLKLQPRRQLVEWLMLQQQLR
jgi:hypothetical protein